ncbi:ABC transporter permease [Carboxydochorda subterranea]|uniref:Transport permease protein n=1 Tax=Carboxydichorda subterranea TaxID=3109565 RepID=A0ABZ1BYA4_9FIRM|nr:ABC transporter permease [Limnochorda sp. L945t]WRP17068.1 ABC transporter permease [Limnochorda sp. L945t]
MSKAELWRELRASLAFVERNVNLSRRYLGWEVVFLVYTVVNTLSIGLIGVGAPGVPADARLVLYLLTGALLWSFLSVVFTEVGQAVQWERWEGTIEYTFMAPIRLVTYLSGNSLWAVGYATLRTVVLLLATAAFFRLDLSRANAPGAALVLVASGLSFVGLGLVASVLPLLSTEKGAQATNIFQAVLLLISGVYYDVTALPAWLQPLAWLSPATYTLRATRAALIDGAPTASLLPDILRLVAMALVLAPLGFFVFRMGAVYALRTGKLKRNG